MKTRILLSFLTLVGFSSYAQLNQYQTSHDLGNDDYANDVIYNPNLSSFMIAGSSNSNTGATYDAALMISDGEGTLGSEGGQVGGLGGEIGRTITIHSSNEVTVAGSSGSFSPTPQSVNDFFVLHLDVTGSPTWIKAWGTDSVDVGQAVTEANDGDVIVAGRTNRRNGQRTDALVVKLKAADGDTVWAVEVGHPFINEAAYDVSGFGLGNGYGVVGWSGANVIGANDAMVVVLNDDGTKSFSAVFGGPGEDDGRAFVPTTTEGVFFVAGNTRNIGAGNGDAFLAKFDASGGLPVMSWFKTYGGASEESLQAAIGSSDGSVYMVGTTNSFGNGQEAFIVKTNSDGVVQWSNVYGGSGDDFFQSIVETPQGGFLATGASNSFGGTASDVYLVGIDANGNSSCGQSAAAFVEATQPSPSVVDFNFTDPNASTDLTSTPVTLTDRAANPGFGENSPTSSVLCLTIGVDETEDEMEIGMYPVPASDFLNIKLPSEGNYTASVYSVDGKMVYSETINSSNAQLNIQDLVAGMYLLELNNDGQIWTSKFLKN